MVISRDQPARSQPAHSQIMDVFSYLRGSRALTEEEEEQIRLRIHNCDHTINQITSNAAAVEAHLVLPANGGNRGDYDTCTRYIKNMDDLVTLVCCICFH